MYHVNEVFYSVQGEGMRAGTANVFVRFSGCNLTCTRDGEAGFDCDTEFVSGRKMTWLDLWEEIGKALEREGCKRMAWLERSPWIILTGGEPSLQVTDELLQCFHKAGVRVAIETNGTRELPEAIDWISCSPKSAEHTLKVRRVDELRYVRNAGQGIPRPNPNIAYDHLLLSPAFRTLPDGRHEAEPGALAWCLQLVKENPEWRLSVQQHKLWAVR